jgi:RND family efflux transporter MFP subunit
MEAEAELARLTARRELELARLTARRELELTLRETAVIAAQANLDGAVSRLDNSTLKAPWDGYVSEVLVEENKEINAVDPILEVIDYGVVEVDGRVDEFEVLSLERGAVAAVTLDSLPDQTLEGVVTKVSSDTTREQGSATFSAAVKVVLPEGLRLQEGLRATAKVSLGEEHGLLVPNPAIRGDYDNPVVLVVNGDEVEERAVVLGSSDGFWTVVKEGLSENERIVFEVSPPDARGFRGSVTVGDQEYEEAETIVVEEP